MTDDAYLDGLLNELVVTEPREAWSDVVARARRSRRRYLAVVAAIATLVLAPSAWAIDQLWSASQAAASGITLSAPQTPTPSAADAEAAIAAASRAYSDYPLKSYRFAHCVDDQRAPRLDQDCWAVFLNPEGETSSGPAGSQSQKATYLLVLVDPSTDQVIEADSGSSP